MPNNSALRSADRNKNDEFYTQLADIELELKIIRNISKIKLSYATVMILMNLIFLNISQ